MDELGIEPTDACPHRRSQIPHWLKTEIVGKLGLLFTSSSDLGKELLGLEDNDHLQKLLKENSIKDFMKNTYNKSKQHKDIFLSYDPAAGGPKSKSTFIAGIKDNEKIVVSFIFFFIYLFFTKIFNFIKIFFNIHTITR